jgi:cell volume regulation protein A
VSDTEMYALEVLVASAAALVALFLNRLAVRIRVPTPLLILVATAVVRELIPGAGFADFITVDHVVTIALVLILFDGGLRMGWRRFRRAAVPISVAGVLGTFLTAAAAAVLLHLLGLDWYAAVLGATAVAPTDPAVVFSVLGQREIQGRSGTILEGESGANDPVGIALMGGLVAAGGLSWMAAGQVALTFLTQLAVGAAVGYVGGLGLLWVMRHVSLPSEPLYSLRTAFFAFSIFGLATVAHGSGFLAVFVAGILIGDPSTPYKREIIRFHSALGSLAEIVAFLVLGLTVDLDVLARPDVWVPGLVLGVALAVVIRPLLVGACLRPAGLQRNELAFVLFAGLKGAVPILLGEMIRVTGIEGADRLYGIVVVLVIFSVLVQGSLVPAAVRRLHLPTQEIAVEPWALGVRLRSEPENAHRFRIAPGSEADGMTIDDLHAHVGDVWVSIVVRDSELVRVAPGTRLEAGDDLIVIAEPEQRDALRGALRRG